MLFYNLQIATHKGGDGKTRGLFYPDFIIKSITGKIYVLDTKANNGGPTSIEESSETRAKISSLQKWIKEKKYNWVCVIIQYENGSFKRKWINNQNQIEEESLEIN